MPSADRLARNSRGTFQQEFYIRPTYSTLMCVDRAITETISYGHDSVGSEFLFLGILPDTEVQSCLSQLGIRIERMHSAVEFMVGKGQESGSRADLELDKYAMQAIRLGVKEARRFNDEVLKPDHLLLGLTACEGVAAGLIASIGYDYSQVLKSVVHQRMERLKSLLQ